MRKAVEKINLDDRTDVREIISRPVWSDVIAILGVGKLEGWGDNTHTVMAIPSNARYPYAIPAHAKLTDEEAATLPQCDSIADYCKRFEDY